MHIHTSKAYLVERRAPWETGTPAGDLETASLGTRVGINIDKKPTCDACRSNKVQDLLLLLVCLLAFGQLPTAALQIHGAEIQLVQR